MSVLRTLRERVGLTQAQLAERVGAAQAQIARMESGQRKVTLDWAVRLGPALGIDASELLVRLLEEQSRRPAAPRAAAEYEPAPRTVDRNLMPMRAARGGRDEEMVLEDEVIDFVERPPYLKNALAPYAIWVVGSSMMPRYRPGQIIHVNPHKPPIPGSGVIVYKPNRTVLIKEFVRRLPAGVLVREYQPVDREFLVPQAELGEIHTVVGLQEP